MSGDWFLRGGFPCAGHQSPGALRIHAVVARKCFWRDDVITEQAIET